MPVATEEPRTSPAGPRAGAALPDEVRRRDLRRMKASATGLLLVAALLYVVARRWESAGGPEVAGYLRAAAEAGMVGGLADWFAVTALFRHPLGLPIPHTALIPTNKDALGRNLGDFVGRNFLSPQVLHDKLRRADVTGRVGAWLAQERNARRVTAEAATVLRAGIGLLRDEDLHAVVEQAVRRRLSAVPVAPALGRLLNRVLADGAHHDLVDLLVRRGHAWLRDNRETVVRAVEVQAPTWSPRILDERVSAKIYTELLRFAEELEGDRGHPARVALDRFLERLADDLHEDASTQARVEQLKLRLLDNAELRSALTELVGAGRRMVLELVDDEEGELRQRACAAVAALGRRLVDDQRLRAVVNRRLEDAAAYVVETYGDEIVSVIGDTVERWDAVETSRKIELQVGRDLQFIRINGTVVGALAGVAIHAVGQLVLQ